MVDDEKVLPVSLCSGLTLSQALPVTESNNVRKLTEKDMEANVKVESTNCEIGGINYVGN